MSPASNLTDLVTMSGLSAEVIESLLKTARMMKEVNSRDIKKVPTLQGRTIINCFLEPSTRTRSSFEIAGKRLSADVINISGSGSSMTKGESAKDMMKNLEAMNADCIVLRAANSGLPAQAAEWLDCPVVNAGDGRHEHPSQSLLDLMTIQEGRGTLKGLSVTIVGDISNSRVARSNLIAMKTLGIKTTLCGPATLLPREIDQFADQVTTNIDEAIKGADVIMMLRIQKERMEQAKFPTLREYSKLFGLSKKRMSSVPDETIIMHPGPINRGIEIAPEVADGPWSLILDQVTNGVAIRMAILYLLAGGKPFPETEGGA